MTSLQPHSEGLRTDNQNRATWKVGVVAIGRNEGERLKRCLDSLSDAAAVYYVDSGSTDGSVQYARELGVTVIGLDMRLPFTAARARNAGFRRMQEMAPDLPYVQFLDGDCELNKSWFEHAVAFLNSHAEFGAVAGRRRERFPDRSVYNWLCDREWDGPVGNVRAFGGDVMVRVNALKSVGGYRDDVIAAEDDELSVRLRAAGWRIWRLDSEMTLHDAAMTHFGQWWRRSLRSGYAFVQGKSLHGAPPERHFVWESRRAWLWGVWLPFACLAVSLGCWPWGLAAWLVYPVQMLRQTLRNRGNPKDRATLAVFQVLSRFPEALGQIKFMRDRLFRKQAQIIEYK